MIEVTSNRTDIYSRPPKPKYTVIKEPPEGKPEFLVIEISLPGIVSIVLSVQTVLLHFEFCYGNHT